MSGWLSVNNKVLNSLWVHPVPRTLSAAGKNLIRKCISNRAASFNPGFLSELEVVQHAREAIALEALSRKSKTNEISPPEQLASFLPKSSMQMSFSNHILSSLPLKTPTDACKF